MADQVSLDTLPTASIAYALGLCMAGRKRPEKAGRISALIAELRRRGEYDAMCDGLDHTLVVSLRVMEGADRGQVWARSHQRPGL